MLARYKSQRGQAMVEYGLIIALISIVVIAALTTLGSNLSDVFILFDEEREVIEEQQEVEEKNHYKKFFFVFTYTDEAVKLDFSRDSDDVIDNLFGIDFGTKQDLQQFLGDKVSLPEENGEVRFTYDTDSDTLTTTVNGRKINGDSSVNTGLKFVFKSMISIFN